MTSAQNPHGGQEATILSLYTTMYHWGAIVVTPGYTDNSIFAAGGNPYGTSVSVDQQGQHGGRRVCGSGTSDETSPASSRMGCGR